MCRSVWCECARNRPIRERNGRLRDERCFAIVRVVLRRKVGIVAPSKLLSSRRSFLKTASACIRVRSSCHIARRGISRQNGLPGATSTRAPFACWTPLLLSRYFTTRYYLALVSTLSSDISFSILNVKSYELLFFTVTLS